MSESNGVKSAVEPGDRVAIGITFGNSNSSIAFTVDDKAEVIANEDGGMLHHSLACFCPWIKETLTWTLPC